jgi:integral membrane protein
MLKQLRLIGIIEGSSFLLLLGVCMPLKYMLEIPEPTKVVGMIHGVFFMYYCLLVLLVAKVKHWPKHHTLLALVASVLPFGPFIVDAKLLKEH